MDQPTALVIMIVCGSLLGLIISWVISYWIIRLAVGAALSRHRDAMAELRRAA